MITKTTLKTFLMPKYARVVNVMYQIANLDSILTSSTPKLHFLMLATEPAQEKP
jgi:hypothetical protein